MPVTQQQVRLFRSLFAGRVDVYGTYDPGSNRVWVVKAPVTDHVIFEHLTGRKPFGVYLLHGDTVSAAAVDFDTEDTNAPRDFTSRMTHLRLPTYVERSKSKGYHIWLFFETPGVKAALARSLMRRVLCEMGSTNIEIFPKQDSLVSSTSYGNFINVPLFGQHVLHGRTVFIDRNLKPYPDQWDLMGAVQRVSAAALVAASKENGMAVPSVGVHPSPLPTATHRVFTFGLRPCAQRMLASGVTTHQREACFWLAVQLRKAGLPHSSTLVVLREWGGKNRPANGKRVIAPNEIGDQVMSAYRAERQYRGCGCGNAAVQPFCEPACQLRHHTPSAVGTN